MPQLMPMNWIFSSSMVFMILLSACVVYSSVERGVKEKLSYEKSSGMKNLWFW